MELEKYLADGVEGLVKDALAATLTNPRESLFMAGYAVSARAAAKRRAELAAGGEHIPPFLIASITEQCNLRCAGCYARAAGACADAAPKNALTDAEWLRIFGEARELGVCFILLAGGEPLLRRELIALAGGIPEIFFPIFTNGTLLDDDYTALFKSKRNLAPILSIEGGEAQTDARRGDGVYARAFAAMERLDAARVLYGVSVTVTKRNIRETTSEDFLERLRKRGCKLVFYVEYVPVTEDTAALAPGEEERALLEQRLAELRERSGEMLYISFPGDEKLSGGCLAAGRGFFHINARGDAEPCPFSPCSDTSLRNTSLREALCSPLFERLRSDGLLTGEHTGGCVLFEKKESVKSIVSELNQSNKNML